MAASRQVAASPFQEFEEEFESILSEPTTEAMKRLTPRVLDVLRVNSSQLAAQLGVSPATVARWRTGKVAHKREIRAMQELVRAHFGAGKTVSGVDFHERMLGIWPFDEFFERATRARRVYVLKNWMGFQAGMNSRIKGALKKLFIDNEGLKICYAFLKGSEAAATFRNFCGEVKLEFPENIEWSELSGEDKPMRMLGDVFASPFIVEYLDDRIDVLLEVPVRVLSSKDANDLSGFTTVFIELPDLQKHRLWSEWKAVLTREFTTVGIKVVWQFSEEIEALRSAAYGLTGSSEDKFDQKSFFVLAECEGEVVGSVRLTDSTKASPLKEWSGGKGTLPCGQKGVVELTRGTVHPAKQGLQIYKWMMVRALREAKNHGFKTATAAIEVDFHLQGFLQSLGFKPVGDVMTFDDLPRKGTKAQSLLCDLEQSAIQWDTVEREFARRTGVKIENIDAQ